MQISPLQEARYSYQPKLPSILREDIAEIVPGKGGKTQSVSDQEKIQKLFPNTYGLPEVDFKKGKNELKGSKVNVGVILSGGQAPGGHNVICGLFDALKKANPENKLFGFLGGPSGIVDDKYIELTAEIIDQYRNTGGFDIIGSGRTKLEQIEQFEKCEAVCRKHEINSIVIIGGDDSNTNAAVLAEYFQAKKNGINVVGCPKTIDGDLKNEYIQTSFGFDTATKTYAELIGNIERDANSAKKYWHFIRLMGRSASHIALECALKTQPNVCLIGEEIEANKTSLTEIVDYLASVVATRAENGENFGVVLVPEGLVEFVPSLKTLIGQLNNLLAKNADEYGKLTEFDAQCAFISKNLSKESAEVFSSLPETIKGQLLMDRDPHGNVQVSRIETEKLLIQMLSERLAEMKKEGKYCGKFSYQSHFFGYEGRCAFPSNFDADYCYSLGYNAFLLLANSLTGYMSSVRNLSAPAVEWIAGGIPITMMMNLEERNGEYKPVIKKALVELDGAPFRYFASKREEWAVKTSFVFPGAIQYYGPTEVCDITTETLGLELNK